MTTTRTKYKNDAGADVTDVTLVPHVDGIAVTDDDDDEGEGEGENINVHVVVRVNVIPLLHIGQR